MNCLLNFTLHREEKLVEHAKSLKVNAGTDPDADLGPVISKQVRACCDVNIGKGFVFGTLFSHYLLFCHI